MEQGNVGRRVVGEPAGQRGGQGIGGEFPVSLVVEIEVGRGRKGAGIAGAGVLAVGAANEINGETGVGETLPERAPPGVVSNSTLRDGIADGHDARGRSGGIARREHKAPRQRETQPMERNSHGPE